MYHNFNAICKKLTKTLALTCFTLLIYSSAQAQHHSYSGLSYGGGSNGDGSNWGISILGGYDVPTGDLATTFKSAPTFGVGVKHNLGDFTFNANIGFVSYKPKMDTIYFDPTDNTAGYIKYDNFSSIQIFVGAAYNIAIGDQAKFYLGLDLGSYYSHFAYFSTDGSGIDNNSSDTYNESSYVAPKLGINFLMSDNLSLGIEGKYNFTFTSSSGSGDAYDYGYSTTTNKSYSGNLVLTYNF
jgi:hypothetical protein